MCKFRILHELLDVILYAENRKPAQLVKVQKRRRLQATVHPEKHITSLASCCAIMLIIAQKL